MSDEVSNEESVVVELNEDTVQNLSTDEKREALNQMSEAQFNEVMDSAEEEQEESRESDTESVEQRIVRLEAENREWQLKHDRMGNELGEKRRILSEQEKMLEESLKEMEENGFADIAADGFSAIDKRNQTQAELHRIRENQQMLQYQENERATKTTIESKIGDISDDLIEGVRKALIDDGVPEQQAKAVNVFGMPRELAFNLFKRASAEAENVRLQEELASLRGGGSILTKVQKAAKAGGSVRGGAGNSATEGETLTRDMIRDMSYDQKKALLSKLQRQHSNKK